MATLNEIIYDILEDIKSNAVSDDLDIDERLIIYKLNIQRALQLRNEYNKPGRLLDEFIIQSLGCVKVRPADSSDCEDFPADCTILETECELPKTMEFNSKTAITKVGPVDMLNYFFSFVPYHQAVFSGNGKFAKNVVYAFIRNKRMYFKVNGTAAKFLTRVNIMGIFEDPTAVENFCTTAGEACFDKDAEYPVSEWMLPYIKEQVVRELVMSMQMPEDNVNDGNSQEAGTVAPQKK
jgi:hypothetical protein